jgi:ElaA protein
MGIARWQMVAMTELTAPDLYAVLAARQQVFAVEQHCAFLDADGHDAHAWHLLGWAGDREAEHLAAYLRVLDPGRKFAEPSIGRVLTLRPHRGVGLGRVLMAEGVVRTAHSVARSCDPGSAAQQQLEAFYASLGFSTASVPYDEDGIAHIDMLLEPDRRLGND